MSKLVFDASAILAVFYNETGKKKVRALLDKSEAFMSSVNLCEVFTKLLEDEVNADDVWDTFFALDINIVDFDASFAMKTSALRISTKHLGLSLADRACLALAIQEKTSAVTADKTWSKLTLCPVELIR